MHNMNKRHKWYRILSVIAIAIIISTPSQALSVISAETVGEKVEITIRPNEEHKEISPYIYGANDGVYLKALSAKSIRMGGNRLTAYNWETNVSNAGSDWSNTSDNWLVGKLLSEQQIEPAALGLYLSDTAKQYNIPFTLLTLQMCGYVAADMNGRVDESEKAPSERWNKVEYRKSADFADTPDLSDGVVYLDEYVNYLVNKLGDSTTETGIKAYALDNEPSLWHGTHSLIQSEPIKCSDLIVKSSSLSQAIKAVDTNALIFGPALYGFNAFTGFQEAPDWQQIKADGGYRWFIDYYLDSMKKESDQAGKRLLDVLDIHFYTEAKGPCGVRSSDCMNFDDEGCLNARMQSTRTLYEEGYIENSWIGQWGKEFLPILPNIQQSIDQYYPGTKLAITEYNFGGGTNISGGVAQADALGCFAKYGVFCATLWAQTDILPMYQYSAINLYTNYDGNGNGFGNTMVSADSNNIKRSTVYAAIDNDNTDTVRVILINKSVNDATPAVITIESEKEYKCAEIYTLTDEAKLIQRQKNFTGITGNRLTYEMPPMSVTELVLVREEGNLSDDGFETAAVITPAAESSTDETTDTASMSVTPAPDETSSLKSTSEKEYGKYYIIGIAALLLCIVGGVLNKTKKRKKN